MKHALYRLKTTKNANLDSDEFVESMMDDLMAKYPGIVGYQYERVDAIYIQILMWGDIQVD